MSTWHADAVTDSSRRASDLARLRREPPRFRQVAVRRLAPLSPRLVRVTLAGDELDGFTVTKPAASVRLLIPERDTTELVVPAWNGNEFLLAGGRRPTIRTFTPRRTDPAALELDLDIVVHGGGAASIWVDQVQRGLGGGDLGSRTRLRHRRHRARVPARRRRNRDPGDEPTPRTPPAERAAPGPDRGRAPRRASHRGRSVARGCHMGRSARGRATRRCTVRGDSCGTRSPQERRSGSQAKPPRCSASVATCSTSATSPVGTQRCAATGNTAAPATTRPSDRASQMPRVAASVRAMTP